MVKPVWVPVQRGPPTPVTAVVLLQCWQQVAFAKMIVGRVRLIKKRYISHGWVEVPRHIDIKTYRFVFEMINLVVMFASLGLNLGLALLVAQCENHILLTFCGLQVIMLIIVLFYTCAYWTVGEYCYIVTETKWCNNSFVSKFSPLTETT